MKSIMMTYPNFQGLPKGLKQLLLASESFFFDEAKTVPVEIKNRQQTIAVSSLSKERLKMGSLLHPAWRN